MTETTEYVFKNGIAYERPAPRVRITAEEMLDAIPRARLQSGQPWSCAVGGGVPASRRTLALTLAARLDPAFCPARVVASAEEFLAAFRACPASGAIVYTVPEESAEVGVQLGVILSMLRYTRIGLVLVLPSIKTLAAPTWKLVNTLLYAVAFDPATMPAWMEGMAGTFWYEVRDNPPGPSSGEPAVRCINLAGTALPGRTEYLVSGVRFVSPTVNGVKVRKVWFPAPAEGETGA